MDPIWVMAFILVGFVIVLIALRIAREVRKAIEREQAKARSEGKELESRYGWLGHIHSYWWALGSAVAGLKFIYRAWKTAPVGSPAKLGWGCLLALIIALAMYVVLRLVDQKMNRPSESPIEGSVESAE